MCPCPFRWHVPQPLPCPWTRVLAVSGCRVYTWGLTEGRFRVNAVGFLAFGAVFVATFTGGMHGVAFLCKRGRGWGAMRWPSGERSRGLRGRGCGSCAPDLSVAGCSALAIAGCSALAVAGCSALAVSIDTCPSRGRVPRLHLGACGGAISCKRGGVFGVWGRFCCRVYRWNARSGVIV